MAQSNFKPADAGDTSASRDASSNSTTFDTAVDLTSRSDSNIARSSTSTNDASSSLPSLEITNDSGSTSDTALSGTASGSRRSGFYSQIDAVINAGGGDSSTNPLMPDIDPAVAKPGDLPSQTGSASESKPGGARYRSGLSQLQDAAIDSTGDSRTNPLMSDTDPQIATPNDVPPQTGSASESKPAGARYRSGLSQLQDATIDATGDSRTNPLMSDTDPQIATPNDVPPPTSPQTTPTEVLQSISAAAAARTQAGMAGLNTAATSAVAVADAVASADAAAAAAVDATAHAAIGGGFFPTPPSDPHKAISPPARAIATPVGPIGAAALSELKNTALSGPNAAIRPFESPPTAPTSSPNGTIIHRQRAPRR